MKKQFCPKGHDTFVTGRYKDSSCIECVRGRKKERAEAQKRWRQRNPEKSRAAAGRCQRYRNTGWTPEHYAEVWALQGERCAICKRPREEGEREFCADHCHQTERQRGILCPQCNSGLGHFKDNIEALSAAIEYLKGHNGY